VLDYAHRREDGSVLSIPDSVKQAFKTTHGRTVYDGGGIDPDVKVENPASHALSQVLFEKGFIFDFVTQYVHKNPKPVDPRAFTFTDEDYQQFLSWMKGKDYSYKSYVEYGIEQLVEEAQKEKYYDGLKAQLDQITARLNESKKNELSLYKDEIRRMIEEEIVARHHLERGRIESAFQHDAEVKKAIEVLHDNAGYRKVLNL
jgi:carboxyl-terminal processing protease